MKQYVIFSPQMLGIYGMGGFWSAVGESWGGIDAAALFFEDDTKKKSAASVAFSTEGDSVWMPLEAARQFAAQIAEGGYAKIRLTVDVTYLLNGVKAQEMQEMLDSAVRRLAGDGGLTGVTPVEVDEYSVNTEIRLSVAPTAKAR